jgi:hypothetical protein
MDLIVQGRITENFIEPSFELIEAFNLRAGRQGLEICRESGNFGPENGLRTVFSVSKCAFSERKEPAEKRTYTLPVLWYS